MRRIVCVERYPSLRAAIWRLTNRATDGSARCSAGAVGLLAGGLGLRFLRDFAVMFAYTSVGTDRRTNKKPPPALCCAGEAT
jgi:hypothetical protein